MKRPRLTPRRQAKVGQAWLYIPGTQEKARHHAGDILCGPVERLGNFQG